MSKNKEQLYAERAQRIQQAIKFEKNDRVPFLFSGPGYAPKSQGLSQAQFCCNPDAALKASLDAMDALNAVAEVDGINTTQAGCFPCLLTEQFWSKVSVPGYELPEDELYQVKEEEIMKVEDYDFIIENGWEAFVEKIRPQIHNQKLWTIHQEWMQKNVPTLKQRYQERGYYAVCCAVTEHPFEAVSGGRSMSKFFRDCYKMPEKVKKVLEMGMDYWVNIGTQIPEITGIPGVWAGGWRIAPSFCNPKLFNEFAWPLYKQLIERVSAAGVTCVLHVDANWDREIHRFLEFPKHSCIVSTDGQTDIRKAREKIGDHLAFMGDVPASVLAMGTPQDVRNYVKNLINDLGKDGLIMNTGCDMPFNTPKANAEAYVLATHEFGS